MTLTTWGNGSDAGYQPMQPAIEEDMREQIFLSQLAQEPQYSFTFKGTLRTIRTVCLSDRSPLRYIMHVRYAHVQDRIVQFMS